MRAGSKRFGRLTVIYVCFQSIKQLANALCQDKLSESSLIRIFWPRKRCNLLRDDVVFVDSPGVDVSPNLNDWIDNFCLNADVFVLVLNAESTMTLAVGSLSNVYSRAIILKPIHCRFLTGETLLPRSLNPAFETEHFCAEQPLGCIGLRAGVPGIGKSKEKEWPGRYNIQ